MRSLQPLRRLLPFYRPYVASFVAVVLASVFVALGEGGQVSLLQPMLNRVLLLDTSSPGEEADADVPRSDPPPDVPDPDLEPGALWRGRVADLTPYDARSNPAPWREDPLCQLLGRTRQLLLDVESNLGDSPQIRTELDRALAHHLAAQALVPDPPAADAETRADAAALSLRARDLARDTSFTSAWDTLWWILLGAAGLGLVLGVARYTSTAVSRVIVARVFRDLQNQVVARLLTHSPAQIHDNRRGDLLTRLTLDLAQTANGVVLPLTEALVTQPVRLVVLLGLAVALHWRLTVGLIVLGVLVSLPIRLWGKFIRRSARVRQDALSQVLEALHQMLAGIRVVKAFHREDFERQRVRERTESAYQAEVGVIRARTASRTWIRLINDISIPLVILAGGHLLLNQQWDLDVGTFAAFLGLIVMMYRPVKSLTTAYNTLQDSLPSLHRIDTVLATPPLIRDRPDATTLTRFEREITFENVWFSYQDEEWVLRDINFTAPKGSTIAIVGLSGAGKSTLCNLIPRFLEPTRGRILLDGRPLDEITHASYLARLAIVSQSPFLFHDTIRENLRYGRLDATDAEVEEAARRVGLHDEILARDGGYDFDVGEQGSKLSGGQRQRLTIARALLADPDILLLDEATSALDTETERALQDRLEAPERQRTTFVIAHRLSTVRHATQILVLQDGELIERGTHDELIALQGRYAELASLVEEEQADEDGGRDSS